MTTYTPASETEVQSLVQKAMASGAPLAIAGGATRAGFGRPSQTADTVSLAKLTGITLLEPSEMVISARAGTPLKLIEETLAKQNQMLPFEPMDHRALLGTTGEPTIGGVFSGNISGPARINRGACRDSAIGVRFVNGRGEIVKSGGRVMKNVTGLDLTKVMCGAFGTLGIVTEVTFKVLPKPERVATLVLDGLDDAKAVAALSLALGSPFEPTGAAHLPAGMGADQARTLIRLENFSASIDYRVAQLGKLLKGFGSARLIEGREADALWVAIRDASLIAEPREACVWRLSLKPSDAPKVVQVIASQLPEARHFCDWGGGLVWLSVPAGQDAGTAVIRQVVAKSGGHATLVRAPLELRAAHPVFQPQPEALAKVTRGVKTSFDPQGLLEPGRMYAGV
ncbi:MAG: FAD-binding protein [Bosea sp. (in: a-proteobacteria)]